jgi:ergothioneine biosynthesis protein EgtB
MADASPTKWHLAHTTWFFDRVVLQPRLGRPSPRPEWDYLFNSYYQSVGPMHERPKRGLLTRPSLQEVLDYRQQVDGALVQALQAGKLDQDARHTLELGLHHEQQHQELILTDIKHALACNPLLPAYDESLPGADRPAGALEWLSFEESIVQAGAHAWPESGAFAYDNESPRHSVLLSPFALATRPVTAGDYLEFIRDGGYRNANLWLSEGWAIVQADDWRRPMYWLDDEREYTLGGPRPIDRDAPVSHLSYYEANAFARWAGARLPTEFEWEHAAGLARVEGNFCEDGLLHPAGHEAAGLRQMFGDVWEWTSSAYSPYPGFRTMPGALGEYNGKFMCSQWVLRGGSCATPRNHIRAAYRNFFPPSARWQFSGVRLARDRV